MNEGLKAIKAWNRVIFHLKRAWRAWDELREAVLEIGPRGIEVLPPQAQKFLGQPSVKGTFEKNLPYLVSTWRSQGGLDSLTIKIEKETK